MQMPAPDPAILRRAGDFGRRLRAVLPEGLVITGPQTAVYENDGYTAYACAPLAVALPSSTEGVARVLKLCAAESVPVVPRGAGTSLAGGALPTADSLVLGLSRMTRLLEFDPASRIVRVEAGMTNLAVSAAVAGAGFFYAPDPSSQLACAIGGNVAMNAGGAHCLKYGVTTNNLLGVRLVTMSGEVLDLGGCWTDAPGLDLLGLVCGSEGQLGVVTEAVLRVLPRPEGARPVLIGFADSAVAGECVSAIIRAGILPVAIEFMDRLVIRATADFSGADYPDCEALLIVEVEGDPAEIDRQLEAIAAIARPLGAGSIRASRSDGESAAIWKGRKAAFGAVGRIGDYICLDGVIPVSRLAEALRGVADLAAGAGLEVGNVFHAGDGNLHPLILFDANAPGALERAEALGDEILKLCVALGGCLTGEHGVGVEKRDLMGHQFTPAELEAQMGLKDAFDPAWLLNPAKVFPLEASAGRRERR
jgi:glycolate oxidase